MKMIHPLIIQYLQMMIEKRRTTSERGKIPQVQIKRKGKHSFKLEIKSMMVRVVQSHQEAVMM